jgi:hypothetical protein
MGGMLGVEVFTDATGLDVIVVVEADNNRVVRINQEVLSNLHGNGCITEAVLIAYLEMKCSTRADLKPCASSKSALPIGQRACSNRLSVRDL